jgi:signal transduction histidine kinase
MQKILLSIFILLSAITAIAQSNKMVDSLLKKLDKEKVDSNRMKLYQKIGTYYIDNNVGKAIDYLENSLEIAKKLDKSLFIANNYYSIGFCYLVKSNFNKSLENYQLSIQLYEKLKDSLRLSNAYMSVGSLYSQTKDFAKTNEYYDKATKIIEAKKDSVQLVSIYNQRGTLYDQQQQLGLAVVYLKKGLDLAKLMKQDFMITNCWSNIGLTYKHLKNNNLALQYFDSVLTAYKKMDVPVDNYAMVYNNVAATYSQAGNYILAKEAFNKSIQLSIQAGIPFVEMENYNNLADMYGRMKQFELQTTFLKKYYNIKDSLFTADNKNQLTQLETDFQVAKKNAEIVKKDAEVIKQKSERNIFIVIATAAALLLTTLFVFYQRIKNNNRLLQQKNEHIHQQNNELEILNQLKDRLFSIISHDLRNPLVTLRTYLSLADDVALTADKKALFKKTTMQAVIQTCDMLDNLLVWANMQIKNTPVSITLVSITDCVLDVVNNVQAQASQKQLHIQTNIEAVTALGDSTIVAIALRNILTNALKFSPVAATIFIESIRQEEQIRITIKDEGIGMTAEQIQQLAGNQTETTRGTNNEKGSGLGIFLTKELLQKINGQLLIESAKEKGSCFTIVLQAV